MENLNHIQFRDQLVECLKKVPPGVNAGSYQDAVRFKAWAASASSAIKGGKTKTYTLQSLVNEYRSFR